MPLWQSYRCVLDLTNCTNTSGLIFRTSLDGVRGAGMVGAPSCFFAAQLVSLVLVSVSYSLYVPKVPWSWNQKLGWHFPDSQFPCVVWLWSAIRRVILKVQPETCSFRPCNNFINTHFPKSNILLLRIPRGFCYLKPSLYWKGIWYQSSCRQQTPKDGKLIGSLTWLV